MNKLKAFWQKLKSKSKSKTFYIVSLLFFVAVFLFVFIVGVIMPNTSSVASADYQSSKASGGPPSNYQQNQSAILIQNSSNTGRFKYSQVDLVPNTPYGFLSTSEGRGIFLISGKSSGANSGIEFLSQSSLFLVSFWAFSVNRGGTGNMYLTFTVHGSPFTDFNRLLVITDLDVDSPNYGSSITVTSLDIFTISDRHNSFYSSPFEVVTFLGGSLNSGLSFDVAPQFQYILGFFTTSSFYQSGYLNGYDNGYDIGYSSGKDVSYSEGYASGYNVAQTEKLSNPLSFFIDPIQTFLDMKLFGVISLGSILSIALFILVAIIFLKIFAGG